MTYSDFAFAAVGAAFGRFAAVYHGVYVCVV